ncbi:MAG: hypothetical protein HY825_01485 [Acidobacteria bacterium]|nr:hypothetical protein [Acidobacteriota bacterium]
MRTLPLSASDDELLAAVAEWTELLARGDYGDAVEMLYWPPEEGDPLPPADLETLVRNYGSYEPMRDGSTYHVTPIGTARLEPGARPPTHSVDRDAPSARRDTDPGTRGGIWFQLPLNGFWSDLVARFGIYEHEGGLVLAIEGLDVP